MRLIIMRFGVWGEKKMERLTSQLSEQFKRSRDLKERIKGNLKRIGYEIESSTSLLYIKSSICR
jgi:hypothetical protein